MAGADPALGSNDSAPGGAGKKPNELALRIASGLIMAPLAVAIAYVGGWPFAVFWCLAAVGVVWEWSRLVAGAASLPAFAGGVAALVFALPFVTLGQPYAALALIAIGAAAAAAVVPVRRGWNAAGVLYAGIVLFAPVLLRGDRELGFVAIVFLFAVVWLTDIVAYAVGRKVGGPKLAPALSPNKTWSGALGGAAAAAAGGIATAAAFGLGRLWAVGLVAFGLSVVSQAGDLFESTVKRRFGAKDAGNLIPGHGGLMDRLDGFLAAALAAAVLGMLRGGTDAPARGLLVW